MLEAANLEEKQAWLAAITAHTQYVEGSVQAGQAVQQQLQTQQQKSDSNITVVGMYIYCMYILYVCICSVLYSIGCGSMNNSVLFSHTSSIHYIYIYIILYTNTHSHTHTVPITGHNDPRPWHVYLNPATHETIILTGLVNKPNPVGKTMLRQLILTSQKRLLYVDHKTLELKGSIEWPLPGAASTVVEPFVKIVSYVFCMCACSCCSDVCNSNSNSSIADVVVEFLSYGWDRFDCISLYSLYVNYI